MRPTAQHEPTQAALYNLQQKTIQTHVNCTIKSDIIPSKLKNIWLYEIAECYTPVAFYCVRDNQHLILILITFMLNFDCVKKVQIIIVQEKIISYAAILGIKVGAIALRNLKSVIFLSFCGYFACLGKFIKRVQWTFIC